MIIREGADAPLSAILNVIPFTFEQPWSRN